MERYIIIRDYYTYKIIQKVRVKHNTSITFKPEVVGGKRTMVIRSWITGEPIQKFTIKFGGSIQYECITK